MALNKASEHSAAANETEWYPSGSRGRPAKALVRFSVARVQIPATPPHASRLNVGSNDLHFLLYFCIVVANSDKLSTTFRIFGEFSSVSKKSKKYRPKELKNRQFIFCFYHPIRTNCLIWALKIFRVQIGYIQLSAVFADIPFG